MSYIFIFGYFFIFSLTGALNQNDFPPSYCPYTSSDVVRIIAHNLTQLRLLEELISSYKTIDGSETVKWITPNRVGSPGLYMTRSSMAEYLVVEAKLLGLSADIILNNVQRNLIEPNFIDPATRHLRFLKGYPSKRFILSEYHPLDEIYNYLDALHIEYSKLCKVEEIGTTYEGRPLRVLKIGTNQHSNPIILVDATMHAREWLSTATALFIANQLITRYESDYDIKMLVDNITWYILPVVNADGYEFTWTQDRKWRQNRSPPRLCISERCLCRGTDLNRNWDSEWNSTGSCNHPCCETYPGLSAMSELEVQHLSRLMRSLMPRLLSYISLHTYGQLWAYPYNYKRKTYPPDWKELRAVALMAAEAVQTVNGARYQVGTGADILYASSGCSTDWAKEHLGVKYSYLIELYPAIYDLKYGSGHFCPDPSVIVPTAEGIFAGLKIVADAVMGRLRVDWNNITAHSHFLRTSNSCSIVFSSLGYFVIILFVASLLVVKN